MKKMFEFLDHLPYILITVRERSGSVVECLPDSRPRGRGFEPHRRHCVMFPEQDTFILA